MILLNHLYCTNAKSICSGPHRFQYLGSNIPTYGIHCILHCLIHSKGQCGITLACWRPSTPKKKRSPFCHSTSLLDGTWSKSRYRLSVIAGVSGVDHAHLIKKRAFSIHKKIIIVIAQSDKINELKRIDEDMFEHEVL
jgi:hypothetical protein